MRETQREAKRPTRQDSPPGAAPQCLGLAPSMGAGSAGHAAPLLGRASSAPRERFSGGEAITASSFLFFLAAAPQPAAARTAPGPSGVRGRKEGGGSRGGQSARSGCEGSSERHQHVRLPV